MNAKKIEYHQGAIADAKSAIAWYLERSPRIALDFIDELRRSAEVIQEAPDRWPEGENGTRRFLLWRFPFSIIYSEQQSGITVWAVAHGSRRPGYWADRL